MNLRDYLNKQVGFIRVNKSIVYTDKSYECAAWWEERTSETGVYPLMLKPAESLYPERPNFVVAASIPATVSADYFPALWAGVAISNKPYDCYKNVGRKCRDIDIRADLVQAICDTGISPNEKGNDWYVNPEIWELVIKNREEELVKSYKNLPRWWDEYLAGEDEFHSRVGMIAHIAQDLVRYPREIQELYRRLGYLNQATDLWRELHKKNTSWIHG